MTLPRLATACLLLGLIAWPVLLPVAECLASPAAWFDADHFFTLAQNTLLLLLGVVAATLPVGLALSLLLFRTKPPGRRFWIAASVAVLFVPLPVLLSAWQAVVGHDGWLPLGLQPRGRMWTVGLLPAIALHSVAWLPWVVLWLGLGWARVDPGLEEEALLAATPRRVLWRVVLPRLRPALLGAALFLILQTAGETCVTYFLQVPTFAEEIHVQFSGGNPEALARSVRLALPGIVCLAAVLLLLVPWLERAVPSLEQSFARVRRYDLGNLRTPACLLLGGVGLAAFVLPLAGLLWKLGLTGTPPMWSGSQAWHVFAQEGRLYFTTAARAWLEAAGTAATTTLLALWCCWLGRDSRCFRTLLLGLGVLAWSMPAPLVGLGLKQAIAVLADMPMLRAMLYDGPSPLPIAWAQGMRAFPLALAILWPSVRMIPREVVDAARLDGAGPVQEFWRVIVPSVRWSCGWATLLLTAFCLGEVTASNRVETPGWETFLKLIFDRMHYGVDGTVAALCLMQVGILVNALLGVAIAWSVAKNRS